MLFCDAFMFPPFLFAPSGVYLLHVNLKLPAPDLPLSQPPEMIPLTRCENFGRVDVERKGDLTEAGTFFIGESMTESSASEPWRAPAPGTEKLTDWTRL